MFGLALSLLGLSFSATAEPRAVAFLAREVQRWPGENKCYSCHNNGDGARALLAARQHGYPLPPQALDGTLAWLVRPHTWHKNGGDGDFKDEGLTRIQFAAALVTALEAGVVKDQQALRNAAELVAVGQHKSGCWQADFPADVGSPVTYGACLATYHARELLRRTDAEKYREQIARADAWLLQAPVARVLDAGAVLLALQGLTGQKAAEKRQHCLETIGKGQGKDGGWGPFVTAPAEVFDTALVVLALVSVQRDEMQNALRKGRAFLLAQQKPDGSWPETTRPGGGESYAQRISTTALALRALLAARQ